MTGLDVRRTVCADAERSMRTIFTATGRRPSAVMARMFQAVRPRPAFGARPGRRPTPPGRRSRRTAAAPDPAPAVCEHVDTGAQGDLGFPAFLGGSAGESESRP